MRRFSLFFLFLSVASLVMRAQDGPSAIVAAKQINDRNNATAKQADPNVTHIDDRKAFTVKHVDQDVVFLDAGNNAGLVEGMTLVIKRYGRAYTPSGAEFQGNMIVAILEVTSVSSTSAMCQVHARNQEIRRGDNAWLSSTDRKPTRRPAVAAEQAPAPVTADTNVQRSPGGYWTTPDQKPQPGLEPAPLSLAERARLAAANTAAQSKWELPGGTDVIPPVPPNAASASASTPPAGNAPGLNNGQNNAKPELVLSVADRARLVRASRAAQDQTTAQAGSAQPQPENGVTASAMPSAVMSPAPVASGTTTEVSAQPALAQPSPAATTSNRNDLTPAFPSNSVVATAVKPEVSATPALQPPTPAAGAKAPISPTAAANVSQPPASALPLHSGAAIDAGAPVAAPAVAGATTAQPAPPPALAVTASISKVGEGGGPGQSNPVPATANAPSTPSVLRTTFKIKYVAQDAVYIEGGKNAGLVEGMTLAVERLTDPNASSEGPRPSASNSIAEVAVVSVSNTSAVCEIRTKSTDIQRGDLAVLSQSDQEKLAQANTLGPTRKYPQVIAFSEGDPLDEEQREVVPRPPLPEINRARGRIGLDYTFINSSGTSSLTTAQIGGVVRIDMSRIGGTYWNLNGYWRGRLNAFSSSSTQPQSVYDLVNRTYTLGSTYVNPSSPWTAGVGRLYLPWATSLDTFDGGYLGRRFGKHTIVGAFAGTDPDPVSFNYNPDLRTAGTFVAFEAGSFDSLRFTSTEGIAVSGIGWSENRQFVFNETGLFYKRYLSVYNATQVDKQHLPSGGLTEGLSRSFSTLRVQPFSRLSIDVNHSYFRDVPTFSAALISTGLLDKYLFQGLSVGSRVELPGRISVYGNFGQSNRSGDTHSSFNQLYGVTLGRLWFTGIRADVRYSKFASSFGAGNYRAVSLSRSFKDALRLEVNAGKQSFISSLGVPTDYRLLGSTVDLNLGTHYFLETAFNAQRGLQQSYNQWIATTGYRFDIKRGK